MQKSSPISPETMDRLAFIRLVLNQGVSQSLQAEPMSSLSVLAFHDAIELFLQLSLEQLDADFSSKKTDFLGYFDLIDKKLSPQALSQKNSMKRLNQARVSLKHHGIRPATADISTFRTLTETFFVENTPLVFDISFSNVSLANVVSFATVKPFLTMAESYISTENYVDAIEETAKAFEELIHAVQTSYSSEHRRSPFPTPDNFDSDSAFHRGAIDAFGTTRQGQFEDKLLSALKEMQPIVFVLSLGIDYRKYAQFKMLTPTVYRGWNGDYVVFTRLPMVEADDGEQPRKDAAEFCFSFVIEAALRMTSNTYEFVKMLQT